MTSSDPFDDDDDLFNDNETLAALEAQAKAAQAPAKNRIMQKYHHTMAQPKAGPSGPSTTSKNGKGNFGGRNAPAPLNTEPRAGVGGFGWQEGGKRVVEGNIDRHLASIDERQAYWKGEIAKGTQAQGKKRLTEEYPDVIVKPDGAYGFGEGGGALLHAASQARASEGAAARRAAIAAATANVHKAPEAKPILQSVNPLSQAKAAPKADKFPSNDRTLSRSMSAGHHPVARTNSRGFGGQMSAKQSQSSSQGQQVLPSSQGSLARKTALELDEERRRREAAEEELARLKLKVAEQEERILAEREAREREEDRRQLDGQDERGQGASDKPREDDEDMTTKYKQLQEEMWTAKGEAEQVRRKKQEEITKHLAEAERLRHTITDMETRLRERDKEAQRQVENVKTQAVFANHAAHNSVLKTRASSQRPMSTPMRNGSPQGKSHGESLLRTIKGKGKALPSVAPPVPKFAGFNDAFASVPQVKVKKQKREPTPFQRTPTPSPVKVATPRPALSQRVSEDENAAGPSSPVQSVYDDGGDVMMLDFPDIQEAGFVLEEEQTKAELLYHLFNDTPFSPFQTARDKASTLQPTLFRLISHHPSSSHCVGLLQACGDDGLDMDALLEQLAKTCLDILQTKDALEDTGEFPEKPITYEDLAALINVLRLLSSTVWRFDRFAPILVQTIPLSETLRFIASCVFVDYLRRELSDRLRKSDANVPEVKAQSDDAIEPYVRTQDVRRPVTPPPVNPKIHYWYKELGEALCDLATAVCLQGEGSWGQDDLVEIIMRTTDNRLEPEIIMAGVKLIWAAGSHRTNFRPMNMSSKTHGYPGDQPVLERISRLILHPPQGVSEDYVYEMTTLLIHGLSMMTLADPDATQLIGEKTLVTVALTLFLRRESHKVWGICIDDHDTERSMRIVQQALSLLHHLIYPVAYPRSLTHGEAHIPPASQAQSQSPQNPLPGYANSGPDTELDKLDPPIGPEYPLGVDFVRIVREADSTREFNGFGHQFVAVMGLLSYGVPGDVIDVENENILLLIQEMAQDVLETLVEGPEADAVFDLYADAIDGDDPMGEGDLNPPDPPDPEEEEELAESDVDPTVLNGLVVDSD